jgi:hypothetical protein
MPKLLILILSEVAKKIEEFRLEINLEVSIGHPSETLKNSLKYENLEFWVGVTTRYINFGIIVY